jgi:hypothetical protein
MKDCIIEAEQAKTKPKVGKICNNRGSKNESSS